MPFVLTMPKLSPTMTEGTLVKWHKKEGDEVKEGDLLFEVATDKATVEYNAFDAGFLRKILVHEKEECSVNQAVAIFTISKNESIEGYQIETEPPVEQSLSLKEEVKKEEDQPSSPLSRHISETMVQPTFQIEPPLKEYSFAFDTTYKERLAASPLAKKLAQERGIDLFTVKGSGPNGRIMSRDLNLAQKSNTVAFGSTQMPQTMPGSYFLEPLTPMRKAIGGKLQASKTFIPHFYIQQDIDVHLMVDLRNQLKNTGVKITFNDLIIRATALALKKHPVLNSGFDAANDAVVHFQTIDIAIAVSLDEGLITPIIRHVDYKNVGQISAEVKYLSSLAKEGKLQSTQYRGGSFTISNLGMFGIQNFHAIINPPQSSILAVGGIRNCPVVKENQIVPGKRMMVSLSSDHRVIDGSEGAKFIKTLQEFIENPAILLL